jgi:hypothetical protein
VTNSQASSFSRSLDRLAALRADAEVQCAAVPASSPIDSIVPKDMFPLGHTCFHTSDLGDVQVLRDLDHFQMGRGQVALSLTYYPGREEAIRITLHDQRSVHPFAGRLEQTRAGFRLVGQNEGDPSITFDKDAEGIRVTAEGLNALFPDHQPVLLKRA